MTSPDPRDIFRHEAQELLEQLEQALLDLETSPDDGELISSAFRALHTLKGSGAMFGFEAAARFAHGLENAFDLVRKGKVSVTAPLVGVTLTAKDHLRRLIEQPDAPQTAESDRILGELNQVIGIGHPDAPAPDGGKNRPRPGRRQDHHLSHPDPLRPGRHGQRHQSLLLIAELRELGACTICPLTKDIPSLDEIEATRCYVGWGHYSDHRQTPCGDR